MAEQIRDNIDCAMVVVLVERFNERWTGWSRAERQNEQQHRKIRPWRPSVIFHIDCETFAPADQSSDRA